MEGRTSLIYQPSPKHSGNRSPQIGLVTPKSPRYLRNIFRRKNHGKERCYLPEDVIQSLISTASIEVLESLDFIQAGEYVLAVDTRRWFTHTTRAKCQLSEDFLHIRCQKYRFHCAPFRFGIKETKIDLGAVLMIRAGRQGKASKYSETQCFSLVFEEVTEKPLNFVTPHEETAAKWIRGINYLKHKFNSVPPRIKHKLAGWEIYRDLYNGCDGRISYDNVSKILRQHGIRKHQNEEDAFQSASNNTKLINFEEFYEFYLVATLPSHVNEIFATYSADNTHLTARELYKFFQTSQCDAGITEKECKEIIDNFEPLEEFRGDNLLSAYGFGHFIKSSYCEVFNRKHDEIYQDMKQPLSHYFIASSHNTYLVGDQIKDPSSTDAYMNALLKGCRCVELDCWDGPDGDPIIFHGHTLTSKIKFKDAIEVIGKHAFDTSRFPLILSIENHCSVAQQEKMAKYMKTIFGSELLVDSLLPETLETSFPSPTALQGKILVKGKKLHPRSSSQIAAEDGDVSEDDEAQETAVFFEALKGHSSRRSNTNATYSKSKNEKDLFKFQRNIPTNDCANLLPGSGACLKNSNRESSTTFDSSIPSSTQSSTKVKSTVKKLKLAKGLSDQVIYCKSTKFTTFTDLFPKSFREMSSFSENKAYKLATQQQTEAIEYHKTYLSRTYPSGTRTDSSNYDPQPLWNAGMQIVALNYQTKCDQMDINLGKFRQNGHCGYILKPSFMRDAETKLEDIPTDPKSFKISIVSITGVLNLRYEGVAVEIIISGMPEDESRQTFQIMNNNSENHDEELVFKILFPSLAMVRILVKDRNFERIGTCSLPFESLCQGERFKTDDIIVMAHDIVQGYRNVNLIDRNENIIKLGTFLIRVQISNLKKERFKRLVTRKSFRRGLSFRKMFST